MALTGIGLEASLRTPSDASVRKEDCRAMSEESTRREKWREKGGWLTTCVTPKQCVKNSQIKVSARSYSFEYEECG